MKKILSTSIILLIVLSTFSIFSRNANAYWRGIPYDPIPGEADFFADAPHRVDPGELIPLLAVIGDAHEQEVNLVGIEIYDDNRDGGPIIRDEFTESITAPVWYRYYFIDPNDLKLRNGIATIRVVFLIKWGFDRHRTVEVRVSSEPLPKISGWYAGDAHIHSSMTYNIWEFGPPVDAIASAARAIGLDWIIITDHGHDIEPIPGYEWHERNEWHVYKEYCDAETIPGEFICMLGEEISCVLAPDDWWSWGSHYLAYGISSPVEAPDWGWIQWPIESKNPTLQGAIDAVANRGGIGFIAHPFDHVRPWLDWTVEDYTGIEVWNGGIDDSDEPWRNEEAMANWTDWLRDGKQVFGIGNSDAHNLYDIAKNVRTYVYLGTNELTENNIIDALRNGHFIFTDGPMLTFTVDGHIIGETFSSSDNIVDLYINYKSTAEYGKVKKVDITVGELFTSFDVDDYEGSISLPFPLLSTGRSYALVSCETETGRRAYTNPIWIDPPMPFVPVDLVLVLDRSGSMGSSMGPKTRMQGAKDSAIAVINALMPHDRVAVVSFATTATTNVQLTGDFEHAKTEIQKISASDLTSFGSGLSLAVNELKDRGSEGHAWAIIFMSDGWHNTAPSPDPYVAECENLGIPIYTVGLGRIPSDVNEALLKQMAEKTGGKYLFAPDLYELQNIFLRFSLEATGWPLVAEFSGLVGEGQTVVAGTFDIDPFTASARVTLNWPGSDLDLIIVRPDGSEVNLGIGLDNIYSGATAKPEWAILLNPQAGTWTVKVYGKVINSPDEPFIVWISTYVPPVPHDTTPPTTSLTIGSPQYIDGLGNTYVTSATEFTLDAIDNGGAGSGVAATAYKISNTTYSTGWITYTAPFNFAGFNDGAYTVAYNSTDNAGNIEPTNTAIIILDNTGPSVTILNPPSGWALQDGVTFTASAIDDGSGVHSLNISIREANGAEGIPVGFEDLPATYNSITGEWTLFFDTLLLPDGYYIVLAKAKDNLGNTGPTLIVPYSIRNWAVLELLPATPNNKAGRTMPIKFALRVAASVDPNQPFVYNEELTIKIYATDNPSNILQTSTFGNTARDYRINTLSEQYITNFQTLKTPKTYMVEIWRKNMLIGSFQFKTVK